MNQTFVLVEITTLENASVAIGKVFLMTFSLGSRSELESFVVYADEAKTHDVSNRLISRVQSLIQNGPVTYVSLNPVMTEHIAKSMGMIISGCENWLDLATMFFALVDICHTPSDIIEDFGRIPNLEERIQHESVILEHLIRLRETRITCHEQLYRVIEMKSSVAG